MRTLTIFGLEKLGLIRPGDNVAQLIFEKAKEEGIILADGDLVVISQKIVSKANGLLVDTLGIKPGQKAGALAKRTKKDPRVIELILQDSTTVLHTKHASLCSP